MSQNVQVDFNPNRENISNAHVGCGTNLRNDIFENVRIFGEMTLCAQSLITRLQPVPTRLPLEESIRPDKAHRQDCPTKV
jgi:hypothetical protein